MRMRFRGVAVIVAVAGLGLLGASAAVAQTSQLTLVVTPPQVANGGTIQASGTAPCASVQVDAHPGARGVRSVGPVLATVTNGRFSVMIPLPRFAADPALPGVDDTQNFTAVCAGTTEPMATAAVHVTGGLAATGSTWSRPAKLAAAMIIVGALVVAMGRRRAEAR